ncbi:MAG: hypothetical protein ACRDGI_03065, partial [Candidatus Limnocylindrales bacterium]
ALAACGSSAPSTTAGGPLSDTKTILAKSLTALNDARTFHLTGSLSGTLEADLTNSGTDSAIDLKGTALTADADVINERASLSISVPALFALKVDYLQIGPDTYSRNSLSGPDWTHSSVAADASSAPSANPTPRRIGSSSPSPAAAPSGSPDGSLDLVGQITAALDSLPNPPTKGPDATCGTKTCYTVEISVPLNGGDATGLGLPLPSGAEASVSVTLSIEADTLLPVHAVAVINAGSNGTFNLALSLSNFNAPVSISAPPAGEVVEESAGP